MMETRSHNDKYKFVSNKELYLGYRYKWYDTTSNTVPKPYFSKKDISEHKYKLTFKEWNEIVDCYIDVVLEYVREGNLYTIPHGLGLLGLVKYKSRYIDYHKGRKALESGEIQKGTFISRENYKLDGHTFRLKWYRGKRHSVLFRNKYLYDMYLLRTTFKKLFYYFMEDKSRIYRISNS